MRGERRGQRRGERGLWERGGCEGGRRGLVRNEKNNGTFKRSHTTTYFISKFPEDCTVVDLWKIFLKWGKVWEVFVSKRRNKWGMRFGFVRFSGVEDVKKLEQQLDSIKIGGVKLYANLPKYHEGVNLSRQGLQNTRLNGGNKIQQRDINQNSGKSVSLQKQTYAMAVKNINAEKSKQWVPKKVEVTETDEYGAWRGESFNVKTEPKEWLQNCLVGRTHEKSKIMFMNEVFLMGGINSIKARHLGDNLFLLSGNEEVNVKQVVQQNLQWFETIFESITVWNEEERPGFRRVWITCRGIPIHLWSRDCFEKVTNKVGDLIDVDERTTSKEVIESARLLIRTSEPTPIVWGKRVQINNMVVSVQLTEEFPVNLNQGCYQGCSSVEGSSLNSSIIGDDMCDLISSASECSGDGGAEDERVDEATVNNVAPGPIGVAYSAGSTSIGVGTAASEMAMVEESKSQGNIALSEGDDARCRFEVPSILSVDAIQTVIHNGEAGGMRRKCVETKVVEDEEEGVVHFPHCNRDILTSGREDSGVGHTTRVLGRDEEDPMIGDGDSSDVRVTDVECTTAKEVGKAIQDTFPGGTGKKKGKNADMIGNKKILQGNDQSTGEGHDYQEEGLKGNGANKCKQKIVIHFKGDIVPEDDQDMGRGSLTSDGPKPTWADSCFGSVGPSKTKLGNNVRTTSDGCLVNNKMVVKAKDRKEVRSGWVGLTEKKGSKQEGVFWLLNRKAEAANMWELGQKLGLEYRGQYKDIVERLGEWDIRDAEAEEMDKENNNGTVGRRCCSL